jgi:hypothetical protein
MMLQTLPNRLLEPVMRRRWREAHSGWVLSTGRVGTRTAVALLALSARVEAHHEPQPRRRTLAKQAYADVWDEPAKYHGPFIEARSRQLGRARFRGRVYVEATNMIYLAPVMADLMPGAKFVHLHRHPGDVVRSGMRRGWFNHHAWDVYRLEPLPGDPDHELWPRWDAFSKVCWVWQAVNAFILRFAASMPADRVHTVGFESLMRPETGAYARLFEFLDLPTPDASRVEEVLSRRDNAQEAGEFPRYRDWSPAQRQTLRRIAGPVMDALGYE